MKRHIRKWDPAVLNTGSAQIRFVGTGHFQCSVRVLLQQNEARADRFVMPKPTQFNRDCFKLRAYPEYVRVPVCPNVLLQRISLLLRKNVLHALGAIRNRCSVLRVRPSPFLVLYQSISGHVLHGARLKVVPVDQLWPTGFARYSSAQVQLKDGRWLVLDCPLLSFMIVGN